MNEFINTYEKKCYILLRASIFIREMNLKKSHKLKINFFPYKIVIYWKNYFHLSLSSRPAFSYFLSSNFYTDYFSYDISRCNTYRVVIDYRSNTDPLALNSRGCIESQEWTRDKMFHISKNIRGRMEEIFYTT